jgi:hypothetical protein
LVIEGFAGVTAIDTSVAAVNVSVAELLFTPPELAEIADGPVPTPVARPAGLIVAAAVTEEFQLTVLVRSCVLLSLNVPVAVNCWVVPLAIDGLLGATAIETNVAAVTASVAALLVTPPDIAVMLDVPVATPVAKPAELIVATEGAAEFHVAIAVRFCVLLSL